MTNKSQKSKNRLASGTLSRRTFLAGAAAATVTGLTMRRPEIIEPAKVAPNERLNIAGIGAGGRGFGNLGRMAETENIVALCDVDDDRAGRAYDQWPNAKRFKDFRKMLDDMSNEIDAVVVSTPDHTHAVATLASIQLGKHVYVEKPLTHSVLESRALAEAARWHGVVTQMGNQGNDRDGLRQTCEMIWNGAIGEVHTVHCWSDRPIWPQGMAERPEESPVPDTLDWDLWLGPAPYRPYAEEAYVPFNWRGWWDFGAGALGDMGCHILNPANLALKLGHPSTVEVIQQDGMTAESFPKSSVIRYEFPERAGMRPVTLFWYDGEEKPPRPDGLDDDVEIGGGDDGTLFIGTDGVMTCERHGENPRLLPERLMNDYEKPDPVLPRGIPHHKEWIMACKGGPEPWSRFDIAGPFTEWVLLGNVAMRAEQRLQWDPENLRFTNVPEANQWLHRDYRDGWPAVGQL